MPQVQVTAGPKGSGLPDGVGFRLIPQSGPATFPRTVRVGSELIYVEGPGWKPRCIEGGTTIVIMQNVPPSSLPAAHAHDAENWIVEVAASCDELAASAPPLPNAQVLCARSLEQYFQNDYTPIFDTLGFKTLRFGFYVATDGSGSAGGIFVATSWDSSGNSDVAGTSTVVPAVTKKAFAKLDDADTGSGPIGSASTPYSAWSRYVGFKFNTVSNLVALEVVGMRS